MGKIMYMDEEYAADTNVSILRKVNNGVNIADITIDGNTTQLYAPEGNIKNIWYGTCNTAAATQAKVITTTSGDFELVAGNMLRVYFVNGNSFTTSGSLITFAVDGNTPVNAVRFHGATTSDYFGSGVCYDYTYTGEEFIQEGIVRATSNQYGVTLLNTSTSSTSTTEAATPSAVKAAYDLANGKQNALVSGTNIKTVNSTSLLGSGNIAVQPTLVSGTNIKTINNTSLLGSGNISISGGSKNVWFGTCNTTASTAAKVVTTSSGDFTLTTGNIVFVHASTANSYNGTATLNVDGTGAKNIVSVGTTTTTRYYWKAGEAIAFIYNGTDFMLFEQGTATTTYYGITKLSSSTSSTSEALAATPKAVKAAYDLAASKPTVTASTTDITAGSTALTTGDLYLVYE